MSAMSPESATSPQTKHTALSVANAKVPTTPTRTSPRLEEQQQQQASRKRPRTSSPTRRHAAAPDAAAEASPWTDDTTGALRRLCLDHADQHRAGAEPVFWQMIAGKLPDACGAVAAAGDTMLPPPPLDLPADAPRIAALLTSPELDEIRRRLLDWHARTETNGTAPPAPPPHHHQTNGARKKRKTEEEEKRDDVLEPLMASEERQATLSKRVHDRMMSFLRENGLAEPSSQDDVMTDFDEMFASINGNAPEWGAINSILATTVYMVYCLARDNRSRMIEAEEELEKEQKKRKWNDDVLWSMINNKCSEVSLRATEQVEQVIKTMKVESGSDFQQLRNDVVAAVTKYLRIQDDNDDNAAMDLPPTPTPPRRELRRRSARAKKDGPSPQVNGKAPDAASTASASSSRVAGFEAELDTAMLSQQLKRLAAQREADARTIEHQKLVILRMDQRLQDLESRVAGVA